jgi:hypothetical protein
MTLIPLETNTQSDTGGGQNRHTVHTDLQLISQDCKIWSAHRRLIRIFGWSAQPIYFLVGRSLPLGPRSLALCTIMDHVEDGFDHAEDHDDAADDDDAGNDQQQEEVDEGREQALAAARVQLQHALQQLAGFETLLRENPNILASVDELGRKSERPCHTQVLTVLALCIFSQSLFVKRYSTPSCMSGDIFFDDY